MSSDHQFGFNTRQLHAGQQPDPTTGSRAVPIYQTTSYQFRDTEHAANLFALKESGNIYTRIMNPTTDVLEQRLAVAGGRRGRHLAASSGHAAQTMAILTCAGPATTSSAAAGSTAAPTTSLATPSRAWASTSTFVDPGDPANFERAIRPNTKILYGETLGNPDISVFPFEEVAAIASKHAHPADDRQHVRHTLPVPAVRVGRQHRHSTARPSSSAATARRSAASIVDGGNFDWRSGRFANFTEPDPSYHGLVYAGLGPPAFITQGPRADPARHRRAARRPSTAG